jgi:hypothetical protein
MTTTSTAAPKRHQLGRVTRPDGDLFRYIRVDLTGRLTILHAPHGGAEVFPLGRRTVTGRVQRLDLPGGLAVWLDSDQQDAGRATNWSATFLYLALRDAGPDVSDELVWLNGPAVLAGFDGHRPVSLTDAQQRRLTARHVRNPRLAALV